MYIKYVESDLMKRIKDKYKRFGSPNLPVETIEQIVDTPTVFDK
jgi:hypothetical protein